MDEDLDPLNIGNVKSTNVKKFSVKTHVMSKSTSSEPVDIFSVTKTKKTKKRTKAEDSDNQVFFESPIQKSLNPNSSIHRRRKSLKEITKKAEQDFESISPRPDVIPPSPSLPEMSSCLADSKEKTTTNNIFDLISTNDTQKSTPTMYKTDLFNDDGNYSNEDFSIYFLKENWKKDPSKSVKPARIKMLNRSIDILDSLFKNLKTDLDKSVLERLNDEASRNAINQKLISTRRRGLEKNRKIAVLQNIYLQKKQKIEEIKKEVIRSKMARTAAFIELLKKMNNESEKDDKLIPAINVEAFQTSLKKMDVEPKARITKIKQKLKRLKPHLREIVPTKPGTGDWYQNIVHPDSKTGQIIQRFEANVNELTYDDVYLIVQHIAKKLDKSSKKKTTNSGLNSPSLNISTSAEIDPKNDLDGDINNTSNNTGNISNSNSIDELALTESENRKFILVEQLMFDLAWQKKKYPFGVIRGDPSHTRIKPHLPVSADLFPAAIGNTLIPKVYAFTPFSALNGMNWPFKSAVDMIFEMFILTNPFEIARVFWNVIQETAQCMQKIYFIDQGIPSEEVEIDFDSLFPVLMICVFTFGSDEWLEIALYTISFNEQVPEDPQLQFAMTYLEGLVTHIMALDPKVLKKKATEMRNKWADEEHDPLGVK